jgi:hypothetical protein
MSDLAVTVETQVSSLYESIRVKFSDGKLSAMEGYLLAMELVGGITQIHAKLVAQGQPSQAVRAACHSAIDKWVVPLLHREFDKLYDRIIAGAIRADEILDHKE